MVPISLERHFKIETHIPEYECDVSGRVKLSYLLKLIQKAAGEHLTSLNLPYELLKEGGQVFLLAKLGLRILHAPMATQPILINTLPQGTKGAQFYREIILTTPQGERLMEAHTVWLLVDPVTRHIQRPDQFKYPLPQLPEPEWLEPLGTARYKPEGQEIGVQKKVVQYSDMDVNEHLNNTVYADMICDCLPYQQLITRGIASFHMNYQKEALLGEEITMTTLQGEDGTYYVVGKKGEERCFEGRVLLA